MRSRTTSWSAVSPCISGNRNFEGRVHAECAGELSRLAAAGGGLLAAGQGHARGHHDGARSGTGNGRQAGLSPRHLADQQGDRRHRGVEPVARASSSTATARSSKGPKQWQAIAGGYATATPTAGSDGVHLREEPAVFRGHHDDTAKPVGDVNGARILADPRGQHHDGPHQPRRQRSARRRPPGSILVSGRSCRRISTATAHAAATMKS